MLQRLPSIACDLDIFSLMKRVIAQQWLNTKLKSSEFDKWLSNLKSLYALNKNAVRKA
jgi:hypothetical protein